MGMPLSTHHATTSVSNKAADTMKIRSLEEGRRRQSSNIDSSSVGGGSNTYSSSSDCCTPEHVKKKIPPMTVFSRGRSSSLAPSPESFHDEPGEKPLTISSIDVANNIITMKKNQHTTSSSDHEAASWDDIELSDVVDDFARDAIPMHRGMRQDKFYVLICVLMTISMIIGVVVAIHSPKEGNSTRTSPTTPPSGGGVVVAAAPPSLLLETKSFPSESPQTLAPILSVGETLPPVRLWKNLFRNDTLIRTSPSDDEDASLLMAGKYDNTEPSALEHIVAPIDSEDEP